MLSCAGRAESIEAPQVARETLVNSFRSLEASLHPIHLKTIANGHAVYEGSFKYQCSADRKAQYKVTARIPLTDPMFHRTEDMKTIPPKAAGGWLQFSFERYTDNQGYGIYV